MNKLLSQSEANLLLKLARRSILADLTGERLDVEAEVYPEALQAWRAPFVTLHHNGDLRGCIGALEPRDSLIREVLRLAPEAAKDPRFERVPLEELPHITISISVLTEPQALSFTDDEDLASKLRPGVDGLILEEGNHRGTLLPAVWESISDPRAFIRATKQKAGLSESHQSPSLMASVYQAEEWSE